MMGGGRVAMPTKDGVFGAPRGSCVMWIILKMGVLVGKSYRPPCGRLLQGCPTQSLMDFTVSSLAW